MDKIELEGGKYTLVNDDGRLYALRYGEAWRDLAGDGLVLALFHEVEQLRDAYLNMRDWAEKNGVNTTAGNTDSVLRPCRSPYCECDPGKCTHPGCYDARGVTEPDEVEKSKAYLKGYGDGQQWQREFDAAHGVPPTAEPDKGEAFRLWMHLHGHDYRVPERVAIAIFDAGWMAHKQVARGVQEKRND